MGGSIIKMSDLRPVGVSFYMYNQGTLIARGWLIKINFQSPRKQSKGKLATAYLSLDVLCRQVRPFAAAVVEERIVILGY